MLHKQELLMSPEEQLKVFVPIANLSELLETAVDRVCKRLGRTLFPTLSSRLPCHFLLSPTIRMYQAFIELEQSAFSLPIA